MHIRALSTVDDCREVAALEKVIWGYASFEEVIPSAVLVASVKRGGVLLGAFDAAGTMQGYAYAAAALKEGRPAQWSHALGVLPAARDRGLAASLKIAQRQHALGLGVDLIEWSYDPLQASSAHLNFSKLGIVVEEYVANMYGDSSSPLHAGIPTDRFVAEWHLSTPHVERRLEAAARTAAPRGGTTSEARRPPAPIGVRDSAVLAAVLVNASGEAGDWLKPGTAILEADAARVLVEIPTNFTDMLIAEPELARNWRVSTRNIFQAYLSRSYRIVDFFVAREHGRGHYLLARAAS
jgi:predicted GNAT superfamily acetyltransferase